MPNRWISSVAACAAGPRERDCRRPVAEPLEPRLLLSGPELSGIDATSVACEPFDPSLLGDAGALAAVDQAVATGAPFPLSETFRLHSNPAASKTILLDFDGHVTSGTSWNSQYTDDEDIVTPAYSFEGDSSFTDAELERIHHIWGRVAEDYLPFNVDVTTEDPGAAALAKSGGGDTEWGIRICIGGSSYDWYGSGAGGVAYVGAFSWSTDTPCYVFPAQLSNGGEKYTAEAASHETGHTLYLSHDGTSTQEYYSGHGSGPTGWAPIMGVGYYKELVQWSKGEYPDANNKEDDLAIITSRNGFGYRADDHGSTLAAADDLDVTGGTAIAGEGIIERNTDLDYFVFTTGGGWVSLSIKPFYRGPNLDVLATLYDGAGNVIVASNPTGALDATISLSLAAGTYYLSVEGTGDAAAGYSDYDSLGYYSVTGTIVDPNALPWVTLEASDATAAEKGQEPGRFTVKRTGDTAKALEVFYAVGGTAGNGVDYAAVSGSVTIPAGSASAAVTVTPIDDDSEEVEETVILTLQPDPAYYVGSPDTGTVRIADNDRVVSTRDFAVSETTVSGSLTGGDLSATLASDDSYEQIMERQSGGRAKNRYSFLEHVWTFEVTAGGNVTFFVEAHHTANSEGDDFAFEYSTDGVNWTHLLTVTKTSDDDTIQQAPLPGDLSGTVYVRVTDTDRTRGNRTQDTVFIDRLFIRSDPSLPGDATRDGKVDALDYVALKSHIGMSSGATWAQGDFDCDGDVDRDDFLVLEANFRQSASGGAPAPPADGTGAPEADVTPSPQEDSTTAAAGQDAAGAAGPETAAAGEYPRAVRGLEARHPLLAQPPGGLVKRPDIPLREPLLPLRRSDSAASPIRASGAGSPRGSRPS